MCSSQGGHTSDAAFTAFVFSIAFKLFTVTVVYRTIKATEPLFRALKLWYIYPALGWPVNYEKYVNKWTVITGCTDGIGKAYTIELARRGFKKFLLIGRNMTKLVALESVLREKYGVTDVETHVFDFDTTNYDNLPVKQLKEYKIGLLVNCVGIAVDHLVKWTEQPVGMASRIMRVNAMSAVHMTELVLPSMVEADVGIIVNVSSIQGWRPFPLLSTYPSSKAAVAFMSQALSLEYSHTGVRVQSLIPCLVGTKMTRYEGEADGVMVVTPEHYARDAVDVLGMCEITPGCRVHEVQIALFRLLPFWIVRLLTKPYYEFQKERFRRVNRERLAASQ